MAQFDQKTASHAVLIETANVLGAFRDRLVIVGGWVPELLYPNQGHIGSLDVDIAISSAAGAENAYETILKRMLDAGYKHQMPPTHFIKDVAGAPEPVKVDFITGKSGDAGSIRINELLISSLKGIDLAFAACDEMEIAGLMPDGTQNTVRVRIVRPEAFILIKAFALDERIKAKDAYDIAFVLEHYQPSLAALAERVRSQLLAPLAQEAFKILRSKFDSLVSPGPVWAARVDRDEGKDQDQALRAAFENAQELFRLVDLEP